MTDLEDRVKSLFGSFTTVDVTQKIYATAKHFPDSISVYIPNVPYDKLIPSFELRTKLKKTQSSITERNKDEDIERSLRRTQQKVREYVLCNIFELFVTFTFKNDRQDPIKCKAKMANWLKNAQKRKGKFGYIIIPEYHSDGESLHFHALIYGYKGGLVKSINPKNGQPLKKNNRQVYDIPAYTLGHCEAYIIDANWEEQTRVGFYLTKYITKEMPLIFGQNRYWNSKGLKIPIVEDNPKEWYLHETPARVYETQYGRTMIFLKRALTSDKPIDETTNLSTESAV